MLFLFMLMMLGNVHPPTRSQATPTAVRENNKYQKDYIYIPLRLSWMGVHVLHLVSWAMLSDSCTAVFKTCGQCAITGEREWVGFPLLFPFIHLELCVLEGAFLKMLLRTQARSLRRLNGGTNRAVHGVHERFALHTNPTRCDTPAAYVRLLVATTEERNV